MTDVVSKLFSKDMAHEALQENRAEYGFFGGTMFWVNVESVRGLLGYGASSFEPEAGQIDGTFAHALERLFCVVPEIEKKDLYHSDGIRVAKRSYKSNNIPEWSEDHDK